MKQLIEQKNQVQYIICYFSLLLLLLFVRPAGAADDIAISTLASAGESLSTGSKEIATPEQPPASACQNPETEVVWEWDAYYSDVSLHIPLTDKQIPEMYVTNEFEIYRKLFVNSLIPNFMVLETAVFPMPVLGVTSKKYLPGFYRSFNIGGDDLNLLEAFTAGFQEPYALSIFFGEVISFVKPAENKVGTNKGYMGYLASYSNQHIRRNVLIPDHNVEAEWKMKGEKIFRDDKLSWSFRMGAKVHQNPDIANTFYLGIRRKNLDFKDSFFSFLANSDLDMRWDFSTKDGRPLRQQYIIGKVYPIENWHVAFRMDVGLIWEHPDMYSGPLRDNDAHYFSAVLRPNIEF